MTDINNELATESEFVPFEFKLGRLNKVDLDLAPLRTYFESGQLPTAPAKCTYALKILYGMCDNDRLGDCVVAGHIHLTQALDHETANLYTVPSDAAIQTEYFKLTGGQDTGLAEAPFLQTAQKTPILGSQIDSFGSLDPKNQEEIKSSIYTFGGAFLGVTLPQSAQNQFPGTWTVVPNSPIVGGHCIVAIGYDAQFVYIVTWGKVIRCTWAWFTTYTDEAYAIIYSEEVKKNRGPLKTLDIARLRADIAALKQIS
jgi:hypothetical protein